MVRVAAFLLRLPQVLNANSSSSRVSAFSCQKQCMQRMFSTRAGSSIDGSSASSIGVPKDDVVPSLIEAESALLLQNGKALFPGIDREFGSVKFLDGSWHLDKSRNPREEFEKEHIPGARYFDIDQAADKTSTLPHMIPTAEEFARYVTSLNITSNDHVVIYATKDCFSSARVWWTFRLFGHKKVSILNGGLPAWKALNAPVEAGPVPVEATTSPVAAFAAEKIAALYADWQSVLSVVQSGSAQILDARSEGRFRGLAPEPRKGLAGGHIPGSLCLPFNQLLQPDDVTRFKSVPEIRAVLDNAGIVIGSRVVCSCGSGVTSAVLLFGLHLIGVDLNQLSVYDGSWTEWASRGDLPIINPAKDT